VGTVTVTPIRYVAGTVVPLPGDDIDTDRIVPARFVTSVPYGELGAWVFADDRQAAGGGTTHPFDRPCFAAARILVTGDNFGCGSSREHAVAALRGWGIEAIVAPSFAGIFEANALANGVACGVLNPAACRHLQATTTAEPDTRLVMDLEGSTVTLPSSGWQRPFRIAPASRERLLTGRWDPLEQLLETAPQVAAVADALPYHRWSRLPSRTAAGPTTVERTPVTEPLLEIRHRGVEANDG
jgi:3-isopropylmalate/(R)-2-methylmalate dehydratase small subunit